MTLLSASENDTAAVTSGDPQEILWGPLQARQLQEISVQSDEQTQEEEDRVRLSAYFIIAYLAYLVISYIILKYASNFDLILGLIRLMRKNNDTSICCIKAATISYLLYFIVCPIIIALAWSLYIYSKSSENDGVIAAAIFLMLIFSTFVMLGGLIWYGNKWHVSKFVVFFFALGAFSAWVFTITVTLTKENYTYSGVSAVILATNFIPACYILQKKTVWKDVPLYALFRELAKKISNQTEQEHKMLQDMTPVQKRDHQDEAMKQTLSQITSEENTRLRRRITTAIVLYLATLGAYLGVFLAKEKDDTIQGLAFLNPVFILGTDIVILSLREQSTQIRAREGQSVFIYSPTFQSLVLLFCRVLLCYNKQYWLMNQALVYLLVQSICAYDATQTMFLKSESVRDDQSDVIEMLRICPVLQAKIQNQLPELKTSFPFHPAGCCCDFGEFCQWRKFRTQVASFVYFLFFIALNYICSTEPDQLQTERVVFVNEVGQWIYGYLSISISIVLVFYILWYRAFKNSGYIFTCGALLLYILFQAVSIGVGLFFYESVDTEIDLILTAFILLPIVIVSFSAFFGIWVSNDFNGYEHDYLQGKNFKPEEIEAYNNLGFWGKVKHGAWRPRTRKDWVFFSMLLINIVTIFVFLISTAILFKPEYVGVTIALLILVFELSFIMVWKYRATNFDLSAPVVVPMLLGVATLITWVVYMTIDVILDDNEPDYFKQAVVLISVAYFVIMIGTLLYLEYQSVNQEVSRLSCSFWILFGITFLVLVGVGAAAISFTEYGLFGIVWIAVCIFILLNLLLQRYRRFIDILFSICFIVAGVFLLVTSDDADQSFQGISVLYFGMFVLSFGSFCQEYVKNKLKKNRAIFMNAPEVFPMLEYDLNTGTMSNCNAEPMLFFFFIYVILLWAFCTTIIADKEWRYVPLSVIGIALAFAYIYIIEKNVDATTIDRKFFKQATALFYTSCLVTATDYKKRWRNADRDVKAEAADPEREFVEKEQYESRTAYYMELMTLSDWARLLGTYKKDMGYVGFFESISQKPEKVKPQMIVPSQAGLIPEESKNELVNAADNENALEKDRSVEKPGDSRDQHIIGEPNARYISVTSDAFLDGLERKMRNFVGKKTKFGDMIDTWTEIVYRARDEDYYDKKYWAFLNGYLNLKMTQLLDNELSIIETSVKMFIRDYKQKNEKSNLDESMSFGKFLCEMKDEPNILVGFTVFLAEEFLKNSKDDEPNPEKAESIVNDLQILPEGEASSASKLRQNLQKMKTKYGPESNASFDMETFQAESQQLIVSVLEARNVDLMKQVEESRKRDEQRDQRRRAAEEARRFEQEQRDKRRNIKMDEIQQVGFEEDEKLLKLEGDQRLNAHRSSGMDHHQDGEFHEQKAKGELQGDYMYIRAQEMVSSVNAQEGTTTNVFADGVSANDIRQGALGDCYLLSAMSIIAHSRPELIKKIFHPESRIFRYEGIYSIMLYQGKVPTVVTVDDKFMVTQRSKTHAFTRLVTDPVANEREIWPLLIEKAYAKFHGSYSNIEGGLVHTALEELTNGSGQCYKLRDKSVEQMFNTGELWTKMRFWRNKGYLMGAGSPAGSDTDVSPLGIVQGHAYSILDVATIDGNNLVQLRNPWGDDTEWKGAWGDSSDTWNEKRKREAYKRMQMLAGRVEEIGKADGIFWMSFSDFYANFDQLSLCRFFDKEYTEVFVESEWSKTNATAGGCSNYDSVGYNPQMKLIVEAKSNSVPVDCFIELNVQGVSSQESKFGIGFEIYDLKGKKVADRRNPKPKYTNDGGYKVANSVTFDGAIANTESNPLTIIMTTFKPDLEAKFRLTVHFKHEMGNIRLEKF